MSPEIVGGVVGLAVGAVVVTIVNLVVNHYISKSWKHHCPECRRNEMRLIK